MTGEEALAVLSEESGRRRRAKTWMTGGLLTIFAIVGLSMAYGYFARGEMPDFTLMGSLAALLGSGAAFSARHRQAMAKAQELADPRFVGFLLEAYATAERRDSIEASREGLIACLPLLEDPEMLDAKQRGLLYRQLTTARPIALVSEVLGAMARTSGAEAIPYFERFREAATKHKDPEWRRLGDRVLHVLPDVRIRVARAIIEAKSLEAGAATEAEEVRLNLRA